MALLLPDYLCIPPEELGRGQSVRVRILGDMASIAEDMARELAAAVCERQSATLIVPVGPVDQFPIFAKIVNDNRLSLRDVVFINMDEYLTDADEWLPIDHPLSFRGFMNRKFYDLLDPELAPPPEKRVFPDPRDQDGIGTLIAQRGGVDVCFGGIGINGHIAFNEPPEPGEGVPLEQFAALPTRVLSLARETRTINAVTVGGDIEAIPRRCVTIGMSEILSARKLRFYCNRPWQAGVVRRLLHGPITPTCPASLLRRHPDAILTIADYVATLPTIGLR
jgi:glucosamine-6-phosphate deaminase